MKKSDLEFAKKSFGKAKKGFGNSHKNSRKLDEKSVKVEKNFAKNFVKNPARNSAKNFTENSENFDKKSREKMSEKSENFDKKSENSADFENVEISRKEKNLRTKLNNFNLEKDENRARKIENLDEKIDKKFAKIKRKISRARKIQEEKLSRAENSKIYRKSRILYKICAPFFAVGRFFRDKIFRKIAKKSAEFQSRRPHRSFYLTPRAKSKRGIKMRGFFGFSGEVWRLIWKNKKLFLKFLVLYAIFSAVIVGLLSQQNFAALRDALSDANVVGFDKITALFSGALTTGGDSTDAGQQIFAILLFLYGFLTLIWLLRRISNGDKVKLRDGLYGGGAPVLAILVIILMIALQLLPFALALLAYSSVTAVGWVNTGIQIENMAAWCALAVAAVLTLYWICSSFIALIIVTLPGMYPFAALRAAGDLAVGRRVKIVLRLIFMMIPVAILWILILIPAILIDDWLKFSWQPLVPIIVLILTTLTIIWCASYIYLLYRRMVDDPTPPVLSEWKISRAKKRENKMKIRAKKLREKNLQKSRKIDGKIDKKSENLVDNFAKKSNKISQISQKNLKNNFDKISRENLKNFKNFAQNSQNSKTKKAKK